MPQTAAVKNLIPKPRRYFLRNVAPAPQTANPHPPEYRDNRDVIRVSEAWAKSGTHRPPPKIVARLPALVVSVPTKDPLIESTAL
jgi:hypothetical protein